MSTNNTKSVKTQKTTNPKVTAETQAYLDACNDMNTSGNGGISDTRPLTFGADFIADKDKYPRQIQLTAKYGAIVIQRKGGSSFTMSECNEIMLEVMTDKKSPIYQKAELMWVNKKGKEYTQDVLEITTHYSPRIAGNEAWKSKALNKSKSEVFRPATA